MIESLQRGFLLLEDDTRHSGRRSESTEHLVPAGRRRRDTQETEHDPSRLSKQDCCQGSPHDVLYRWCWVRTRVTALLATSWTKRNWRVLETNKGYHFSLNGLTVANRIHILEPQWNPAVENQAIGRVLRLDQQRKVTILRYAMRKSIEEVWFWEMSYRSSRGLSPNADARCDPTRWCKANNFASYSWPVGVS